MLSYIGLNEHEKSLNKLDKQLKLSAERQKHIMDLDKAQDRIANHLAGTNVKYIAVFFENNPWYYPYVSHILKLSET